MKKILKNSVTRSVVAVALLITSLCLATVRPVFSDETSGERGKIYMLTVWTGTSRDASAANNIPDDNRYNWVFRQTVESSREFFEQRLPALHLDPNDSSIIQRYVSLKDGDTHPQKIIDTIYQLANEAGPEDALFVYILSHGAAIDPHMNYGEPEPEVIGDDREHLIMPLIDAKEVNYKTDSLTRGNMLYFMRAKKHRLDVLITDSCSAIIVDDKLQRQSAAPCAMAPGEKPGEYTLRYLLTHAEGTISWNSTNPASRWKLTVNSANDVPADQSAFLPMSLLDEVHDNQSTGRELSLGAAAAGTAFTGAFIRAASRPISNSDEGYTFDDFFQDLGEDYDVLYGQLWAYGKAHNWSMKQLVQGKTTLTQFNVDADRNTDGTANDEAIYKINNRANTRFEHKDPEEWNKECATASRSRKSEVPAIIEDFGVLPGDENKDE
ncbi:MAG: hypothetical protein IJU03_07085 [Thermoguttaceae bacterium]|nr:hypothetical protein [Thermoguttaceae bacterium]